MLLFISLFLVFSVATNAAIATEPKQFPFSLVRAYADHILPDLREKHLDCAAEELTEFCELLEQVEASFGAMLRFAGEPLNGREINAIWDEIEPKIDEQFEQAKADTRNALSAQKVSLIEGYVSSLGASHENNAIPQLAGLLRQNVRDLFKLEKRREKQLKKEGTRGNQQEGDATELAAKYEQTKLGLAYERMLAITRLGQLLKGNGPNEIAAHSAKVDTSAAGRRRRRSGGQNNAYQGGLGCCERTGLGIEKLLTFVFVKPVRGLFRFIARVAYVGTYVCGQIACATFWSFAWLGGWLCPRTCKRVTMCKEPPMEASCAGCCCFEKVHTADNEPGCSCWHVLGRNIDQRWQRH